MQLIRLPLQILSFVSEFVRALRTPTPAPRHARPALTVVPPPPAPAPEKPVAKRSPRQTKAAPKTARVKAPAKAPAKAPVDLPRLTARSSLAGSVWVPRILWALVWSEAQGHGPRSPADLARVLAAEAGLKVAPNNVARAFRTFAKDPAVKGFWKATGKKYKITPAGRAALAKL